ncbi:hypothetical protein B0A54_07101 [Lecanosticta acicola]|uniref:Uncharacterized protein n=1 Tax=Lecanosticta acicola TaxID=111012 RepID=A0AAI8Z0N6_9PEZI|nr:hypothetical protein B0A54_07101 [Lecanosticta acicola]
MAAEQAEHGINGVGNDVKKEDGTETGTKNIGTSSLEALQSKDSRKIMDTVDELRRSGLGGIINLPQLVVCGDQSSGKSSVLEAITEIPFPRRENLCTRFATEIILRRASVAAVSVKIIPDKQRPEPEQKSLKAFKSVIVDFAELPKLMDEATKAMGLTDDGNGPARAFSRDVLSIEIAGPGRPHLTLSKEDVELIRGLMNDYIKEPRTIIMAVVSAKNDYANQIILQKCREVDPKGSRTLGIITKPDFLEPDSENEESWLNLANNKNIRFELGWHILKNRSAKEASNSFEERNSAETAFFSQGRYRSLPREMVGISALCNRLSQMLFKHLRFELPGLRKEVNEKYKETGHELDLLGDKRSTVSDQRRFLMTVSNEFQDIVRAAVTGHYEHDFFGDLDPGEPVSHESNMRRLRAVVQHQNSQFATVMRKYGHKYEIVNEDDELTVASVTEPVPASAQLVDLDEGYAEFAFLQFEVSREDEVKRVRKIMVRSRGRELPGAFNPSLISQLFWNQSANWKIMAEYHVNQVAAAMNDFVKAAIGFCVSEDVADRLQAHKVDAALAQRLEDAKAELYRVLEDTKHHPITYDPVYASIVQTMRHKRHATRLDELVDRAETTVYNGSNKSHEKYLSPAVVRSGMDSLMERDMDKTSAEEALDSQQAYYKREVEYFVASVAKQVIERHLLRNLAGNTISPILVGDMTDEDVALIAAEPEETTRKRDFLEARKKIFQSALRLLK